MLLNTLPVCAEPPDTPGIYCSATASMLDWRDCLEQARQTLSASDYLAELLAFLHSDPVPTAPDFYRGLYRLAHAQGLIRALDSADPLLQRQLLRLLADAARQGLLSTAQQTALRPVVMARLQNAAGQPESDAALLALELAARLGGEQQATFLQRQLGPAEAGVLALYHWQRLGLKPLQPLAAEQLNAWLAADPIPLQTLQYWQLDPLFMQLENAQAFLAHWLQSFSPEALPLSDLQLQTLLQYPEPRLRIFAARRLALRGEAADRQTLDALQQDPDPMVRSAAQQARVLLETTIPARDLARLQDPAALPPDTPERLHRLLQQPAYQSQLLSRSFAHLRPHPAYQAGLWQVILHSQQTPLRSQALDQLQSGGWPLDRLLPVMHPTQPALLRQQGLRAALRQPASPERTAWLQRWQSDADIVLPVLMTENFVTVGDYAAARGVLGQLAARSREPVPLQAGGTERLERYIQRQWPRWLKNMPAAEWQAWLQWVQDRRLPLSWRRGLIRLAADQGPVAIVSAQLRPLAADRLLAQDLEFARERLATRRLQGF
ncbi:MAG: HEAT repeat domain-containing protein [Candidatus Sericytochromatia bacterium]|nr:HEAT repeat domain-containing protein [Candidatus Sericytochromatia bacterium]